MKEEQLQALIALMGTRTSPKTRCAMRDVLTNGMTNKEAAILHGVSPGALSERVRLARKKLRLAYTAITGFEYAPPNKT